MSSVELASRREVLQWLSLGAVGVSAACASRVVESPPPGPWLSSPLSAIPPDLQITLRVAVDRLKSSVAGPTLNRIREDSNLNTALGDPLVLQALDRTSTAWTALRLGATPQQTDNVLVLRGAFRDVVPGSGDWSSPSDLGAGWFSWQRKSKVLRSLPTRVYAKADDLLIFVSEAEIDAVERRLTRSVAPLLEPPERGLVAIAASMPALAEAVRDEAPKAARILDDGDLLTGFADITASGILVDLDFAFHEQERAERAARALKLLSASVAEAGGPLGRLAHSMSVEALARSVVVRFDLPPDVVTHWMSCYEPGACQ